MKGEGTVEEVLAGEAAYAVVCGDAVKVMRGLPDGCAHVCYCDPGYGLTDIDTADVVACLTAWLAKLPYVPRGSGFMGHEWDAWVPGPEAWREVHRALVPGGHCVAYSSTRTVDLLGIAVRLGGFDLREGWAWITGQGFAKSHNVSIAIDKAAGAEREVVGTKAGLPGYREGETGDNEVYGDGLGNGSAKCAVTAPATDAARLWEGHGTALKPVFEPIIVARKALDGTVAENAQTHGAGVFNIDAARIRSGGPSPSAARRESAARSGNAPVGRGDTPSGWADRENAELYAAPRAAERIGRFPASLAIVHEEGCELVGVSTVAGGAGTSCPHWPEPCRGHGDAGRSMSGETRHGAPPPGWMPGGRTETVDEWRCVPGCAAAEIARQRGVWEEGEPGNAARFYYNAKASARDRLVYVTCSAGCAYHGAVWNARQAKRDARRTTLVSVTDARFVNGALLLLDEPVAEVVCASCRWPRGYYQHSTVKPLDLARYHARVLSLPPHVAPVALVPYCGSGPEARALREVGFRVIAIDLDPRHCAMTRHRLALPLEPGDGRDEALGVAAPGVPAVPIARQAKAPRAKANDAQLDLFGAKS